MNAVERLLAQGEQVLSLFDEMYRERLGTKRDANLPDVPQGLIHAVGHIVIDGMPSGQYWSSAHWLQAAAESAWVEVKKTQPKPTREKVASRAADLFREYLTQREQLLAPVTWRRLLSDVVFESREWSPLSEKVVSLAEQVTAAVQQVEQVPGDIEPRKWWRTQLNLRTGATLPARREILRKALDLLHPYAQPPKPVSDASDKQTGGSNQKKRRDRKRGGGRPEKYPLKLMRDVVISRERDEKRAATAKKKSVPPLPIWLRAYCDKHNIDIRERFPAKTPGEAWSVRANRFWKAAKKRVSSPGGN